jgi:thiamine biosynthesis lipoprotein
MPTASEVFEFSVEAMATRFVLMLVDEDVLLANTKAEQIFTDIRNLEYELSRFRPGSDVWRINNADAGEAVSVDPACLDCLLIGREIWQETGGAFDVTIGPLYRILREQDGTPRKADKEELRAAMACTGFDKLAIDAEAGTVTPLVQGVQVDLGAIGKGYALDQSVFNLQEEGVTHALMHSGESTVVALGDQPGRSGWPVTLGGSAPVYLKGNAVSGTGTLYKGAHIIDARKQRLAPRNRDFRWAMAPTATEADALSTAFMVMSPKEIQAYCAAHPGVQAW